MEFVYAYNMDTNRRGIWMTERMWGRLYVLFNRPVHWNFQGYAKHGVSTRERVASERTFWQARIFEV